MREVVPNIDGEKVLVTKHIFTWSNLISLSRVLVVAPIIYLHYQNDKQFNTLIVSLIAYGVLSDFLDGLIARWRNERSELGKMLDPIADKLMAFFLFLYTVWLGWIPIWYFAIGVLRDLLIMTGSLHIKMRRGKVAMSTFSGKLSVNVMALYWMSVFFFRQAETAQEVLMIISVLFMIFSFADYAVRYRKIINGADFN